MKTLNVPFVKGLGKLNPEQFKEAMLRDGACGDVDCLNWSADYPEKPFCRFHIARCRKSLHILFQVSGIGIRGTELEDNGRSWEDSCCEFFLAPGDGTYFNVETSCAGSILLARGEGRNGRVKLPAETVAGVKRWTSVAGGDWNHHLESPLVCGEGEFTWDICLSIPFCTFGLDGENLPEELAANFYKCGDLTSRPHYLSWSPIGTPGPDFHCPAWFGRLRF